ncbi:unnamed protein product [Vitrella brassicaformis CCMP3155]|uniref:Pseudouridine synthase RsuA/RluA-like domain-containing protein n=3 Tax=Vitrella brassicaformis TaxID=1169539 RepID=A0A0G4FEV8_VITBC|nr:unnamed protein product [Vitrella brassicaformis CCMP3155]|eukprot:CEM11775.1 unnamed protein product [Vitrella brassicaformis CCMP3155]
MADTTMPTEQQDSQEHARDPNQSDQQPPAEDPSLPSAIAAPHFDLSAAEQAADGVEALELAGVPAEMVTAAVRRFPGVRDLHVEDEVLARLDQFNFLIQDGALTVEQTHRLIANQPWCLERAIKVVHECEGYVVIDKPDNVRMDVPRTKSHKYDRELTVADWFKRRCPSSDKVRPCHQLDHATSGVLVMGKTKEATGRCAVLFSQRKARKQYLALVYGHPSWDETTVDAAIEEDPNHEFNMQISESGKPSQTAVKVLQRSHLALEGPLKGTPVAKLLLIPATGRRHQLRLHCRHVGHPIVGDYQYSAYGRGHEPPSYRMCLHAYRLELPFDDDGEGQPLVLEAPDPFHTHVFLED